MTSSNSVRALACSFSKRVQSNVGALGIMNTCLPSSIKRGCVLIELGTFWPLGFVLSRDWALRELASISISAYQRTNNQPPRAHTSLPVAGGGARISTWRAATVSADATLRRRCCAEMTRGAYTAGVPGSSQLGMISFCVCSAWLTGDMDDSRAATLMLTACTAGDRRSGSFDV